MGSLTFSEYSVIAEILAAKINPNADLNKACVLGCRVSTGWRATYNSTCVSPRLSVWQFGVLALLVCRSFRPPRFRVQHVYTNQNKAEIAKKFGATEFINSKECDAKDVLLSKEKWGVHFTYDCTGNTQAMRRAL
jgi:S-(hydroxymethyl)glutathione dehydrogenase/alcohol dehydrogenase